MFNILYSLIHTLIHTHSKCISTHTQPNTHLVKRRTRVLFQCSRVACKKSKRLLHSVPFTAKAPSSSLACPRSACPSAPMWRELLMSLLGGGGGGRNEDYRREKKREEEIVEEEEVLEEVEEEEE